MKRLGIFVIAFLASLAVAGGEQVDLALEVFEVPRFMYPPDLDGIRGAVEWADALELECSPSQIERDKAKHGETEWGEDWSKISVNQLLQSKEEADDIARTDADASSFIWHGWDDEGLYFIAEVRDNVRDIDEGRRDENTWWERDSLSLYVDLLNSDDRNKIRGYSAQLFTSLNIINFVADPQHARPKNITWEYSSSLESRTVVPRDADFSEAFTYGFREAYAEFGGEADYTIEGKIPWETLMRFNLSARPEVGTEMGFSYILVDPDGFTREGDGWGGQLQCWGHASSAAHYSTWIFSDTPAGPPSDTAIAEDSWARIKTTFQP
ncbi:MAG: hypothetical protein HOC74_14545 [Gemmatimonadetes bacterium]|jgi:hypothetical protein|nr:hypothetical protein [Gemmatimonadota bacterium]